MQISKFQTKSLWDFNNFESTGKKQIKNQDDDSISLKALQNETRTKQNKQTK